MKTEQWKEEFIEKGAELEHIRWAKWQNYLHSFLTWNNDINAWVLPHEKKDHWQRQIQTPYQQLSEQEKESDRKESRVYLPFIQSLLDQQKKEILGKQIDKVKYTFNGFSGVLGFTKMDIIKLIENYEK